MTQREVYERLRALADARWLELSPVGRRLVLRCLRALEADVAVEQRQGAKRAR